MPVFKYCEVAVITFSPGGTVVRLPECALNNLFDGVSAGIDHGDKIIMLTVPIYYCITDGDWVTLQEHIVASHGGMIVDASRDVMKIVWKSNGGEQTTIRIFGGCFHRLM
jgi:hypothetical protein